MAFRRLSLRLLLSILASVTLSFAATPSLVTYMPDCAQDCVSKALNGTCTGPTDAQCLCNNERTIGPAAIPCAETACNSTVDELIGEFRSGYTQYCSAAGISTTAGSSTQAFGWGAGAGSWGGSTTATATPSSSTSTSTPASTATATNTASPSPSSSSNTLTPGAIAGIAVGGGAGLISLTGGLLLLAFRLGRNHSRRKRASGANPENGSEGTGAKPDDTAPGVEKPQLAGQPVSELATEYTLSGFDPVKELAGRERPAELSAEPPRRWASPVSASSAGGGERGAGDFENRI